MNFDGEQLSVPMQPSSDDTFIPNFISENQIPKEATKRVYHTILEKTIAHLQAKPNEKIVISRVKHEPKVEEPLQLFSKLKALYPGACVYLFTHPAVGTWLGATPEFLVSAHENEVQSISMAGTRKSGHELSFTTKEEVEQQLVTDYILNIFQSEQGLRDIQLSAPALQQAGNLFHFKSEFKAHKNSDFDIMAFAKKLHPTPAVGGLPKIASMDFIKKHEGYDRSYYAGYFGLETEKETKLFVNIRCMQLFENATVLYAGGGITQDSDVQDEWDETEAKFETMGKALSEFKAE